jgi:hypothetical protein
LFAGLGVGLNLGACTQAPQEGVVQVRFSDHRDAIGDFSQFLVEIDSIELHSKDHPVDSAWITLEPQVHQVDLTQLVGEVYRQVLEQRLAANAYNAIRVNLSGVHGLLVTGEEIILDDFSEIARVEFNLAKDEAVGLLVDLKVQSQHDHLDGTYVLLLSDVREFGQASTE